MEKYKSIFITGASSGIGRALALAYAQKEVTLFLSGRNEERLKQTALACQKKGAHVYSKIADVRDSFIMENWIHQADELRPLDLVIATAGVSANVLGDEESEQEARAIFATNVNGVINTVLPAVEIMKKRKKGQIALISSLAGYRSLWQAPAYSASKAAVKNWGEALSKSLSGDNISVTVICPGFVDTPLTKKNKFPMPFLMTAEKAAKIIVKGIGKKKTLLSFPKILTFLVWFRSCMPAFILEWSFRFQMKKGLEKKK